MANFIKIKNKVFNIDKVTLIQYYKDSFYLNFYFEDQFPLVQIGGISKEDYEAFLNQLSIREIKTSGVLEEEKLEEINK